MRLIYSAVLLASLSPLFTGSPARAQEKSPETEQGEGQVDPKAARPVSVPAKRGGDATPVDVSFTVDKATYKTGDFPVIKVTPAKDCRISLFYEDAAGKLVQLFPNQFIAKDTFAAGKEVTLVPQPNPQKPGENVQIEIFGPPFGKEHFIIVATGEEQGILAAAGKGGEDGGPFPEATAKSARVISRVKAGPAAIAAAPAAGQAAAPAGPLTAAGPGTARITVFTVEK